MRKTKIICTIGPASANEETIREMIKAGMNVARLNFSHGEYESHKKIADIVKKVRQELGAHVALLLDTKGPEIRIGRFKDGSVTLKAGNRFTLYLSEREGDESGVSVSYKGLCNDISKGSKIMMDDGLIEHRCENVESGRIDCTVINGGVLSNNKSINLPGIRTSIPFLSEKDKNDIKFAIQEDFDFIAASFTQSADNIHEMRRELELAGGGGIRIIAKIENSAGVESIDEIINVSDGIMIARGDMGVEIPIETIPVIQKKLISKCYKAGKQVITATQMLESMTKNPRPTRAEVTDVANAIYDGTSATMLSGETAAGKYPIEAVKTMSSIAEKTESDIDYKSRFSHLQFNKFNNVTNAISHATCTTAHDLGAAAIITVTQTGETARKISRFRPETPIIGCSPNERTCRQMSLSWGIMPLMVDPMNSTDELLEHAESKTMEAGYLSNGDIAVITAGIPLGIPGTTNMLKVQIVGDVLVSGIGVNDKTVCGILCVSTTEDDAIKNFSDGMILAVPSLNEKLLPIARRAKAIICELGGKDSFSAAVGQVLDIPVIVGAAGATKILKTGTAVTVDGKRGIVYPGET